MSQQSQSSSSPFGGNGDVDALFELGTNNNNNTNNNHHRSQQQLPQEQNTTNNGENTNNNMMLMMGQNNNTDNNIFTSPKNDQFLQESEKHTDFENRMGIWHAAAAWSVS